MRAIRWLPDRDAASALIGTAVFNGANLLSVLGVAAILGSQSFGVLTVLQTTALLAGGLGMLATPTLLTREIAQNPAERRTLTLSALIASLTLALIALLGCLAVGGAMGFMTVLYDRQSTETLALIAAMGVYVAAQVTNVILLARLQGLGAFRQYQRFLLVRGLLVLAPLAVAALTGALLWTFLAMALAELLLATLGLSRVLRRSDNQGPIRQSARHFIRVGFRPGLASQTIPLAGWLALLGLAQAADGLTLTAWYGLGQKLVTGFALVGLAVVTAGTPKIHAAAHTPDALQLQFQSTLRPALAGAILGAIAMVLLAPLSALLGPDYVGADGVLRLLAVTVPLVVLNTLLGTRAVATNALRAWYTSDLLLALVFAMTAFALLQVNPWLALPSALIAAYAVSISWLEVAHRLLARRAHPGAAA